MNPVDEAVAELDAIAERVQRIRPLDSCGRHTVFYEDRSERAAEIRKVAERLRLGLGLRPGLPAQPVPERRRPEPGIAVVDGRPVRVEVRRRRRR